MDFIEELRNLSARIEKQKDAIQTEEATKTTFSQLLCRFLLLGLSSSSLD